MTNTYIPRPARAGGNHRLGGQRPYCRNFGGGQVDITRASRVLGKRGYLIENGKLGAP